MIYQMPICEDKCHKCEKPLGSCLNDPDNHYEGRCLDDIAEVEDEQGVPRFYHWECQPNEKI